MEKELKQLIDEMKKQFPDLKVKYVKQFVLDALTSRSVNLAVAECIEWYIDGASMWLGDANDVERPEAWVRNVNR